MPVIDEDLTTRPGEGYDSNSARNMSLHRECSKLFLGTRPNNARVIMYVDGKARLTQHHVGACIGDMQVRVFKANSTYSACVAYLRFGHIYDSIYEFEKWSCKPHPSCHRCPASILEFLRTTGLPLPAKSMRASVQLANGNRGCRYLKSRRQ
jgi:hypothetical protein